MSRAVAGLGHSLPLYSRIPNLRTSSGGAGSSRYRVKVAAAAPGENRDNLERLQKQSRIEPRQRTARVAPVGLWDRFPTARTVQQMMEAMEQMMEDPFAYSGSTGLPSPVPNSRGRTPWEIKEFENEYKMRFDMPGMTKEDVKVWVEEKMLVVKAEKVPKKREKVNGGGEEEEEEGEWSAKSYGRYSSRIALPENVEFEKIRAEVKDGVLYITIPKASSVGKILDVNVE